MSENNTEQSSSIELPLQASDEGETIPVSTFPDVSVFDKSTTNPAIIIPVKRTVPRAIPELSPSYRGKLG